MSDLISVGSDDDILRLAEEIVHREREVHAYRSNRDRYDRLCNAIPSMNLTRDQVAIAKQDKQHLRARALAVVPREDASVIMSQMRKARYQAQCVSEAEQCLIEEDALNDAKERLLALIALRDGAADHSVLVKEVLSAKERIKARDV